MGPLLVGLDSIINDRACNLIVWQDATGNEIARFFRKSERMWVTEKASPNAISTAELTVEIGRKFGVDLSLCECYCGPEKVVYALEKGSVRVTREAVGVEAWSQTRDPLRDERRCRLLDALGIPKSMRKAKMKQAGRFCGVVERVIPTTNARVRILDVACGRSYLGFALVQALMDRRYDVRLHGVEVNPVLVEKCRDIASKLGWGNCTFESTDVSKYTAQEGAYEILVSLHACDTLTDDAARIACKSRIPYVFLVPCCQREFRDQLRDHPLSWTSRYGLIEERLADVLTDGFRCLVLEALGYDVKVLHFVASDVTPKNLLIQAKLSSAPRPELLLEAQAFLREFNIRPKLAEAINEAIDGNGD